MRAAATLLILSLLQALPTLEAGPWPDGLAFPDWTRAGNPLAQLAGPDRTFAVGDYGAQANDSGDDAAGMQAAIAAAEAAGGGAVQLGEGLYFLDQPVLVTGDRVTIRGEGPDRTRLVFRFGRLAEGLHFARPEAGARIGPETWVEARANPEGLEEFRLYAGDRLIRSQLAAPEASWQQDFALRMRGQRLLEAVPPGPVVLRATARYVDGTQQEASMPVVLDDTLREAPVFPQVVGIGAITFLGARPHGSRIALQRDGLRGDRRLVLSTAAHGLVAGARIQLVAPNTPRWFAEIGCSGPTQPDYRRYHLLVTAVEGDCIEIDQPLRQDYPVVDGAYVCRLDPLENAAIESLELDMRCDIPSLNGIVFLNAWACRARDVRVLNAGRHQLLFSGAKWCRVEDCFLRDPRSKGGGTDYVGFQDAYDCLMENVVGMDMRHGPVVQWSASGNVIRNCRFFGSDAQWHAGWPNENLFENCLVVSRPETGSYGYGMYATPPDDPGHGPNGPRNVVFNCDVYSPMAGVSLGGANTGWTFLYNRFTVERGPGMQLGGPATGHVVAGNVFVLRDPGPAAIVLARGSHAGHRFTGNRFFMPAGTQLLQGPCSGCVEAGNTTDGLPTNAIPDRPEPPVPSLFNWQLEQAQTAPVN